MESRRGVPTGGIERPPHAAQRIVAVERRDRLGGRRVRLLITHLGGREISLLAAFGTNRYASLIGRLSRPSLLAQAAAPPIGAFVLAHGGADALLRALVALAATNLELVAALWRLR